MGIRDHLRNKSGGFEKGAETSSQPPMQQQTPEFTIMRSDTYSQEVLITSSPTKRPAPQLIPRSQSNESVGSQKKQNLLSLFKPRSRGNSVAATNDSFSPTSQGLNSPGEFKSKRLSQRLGLGKRELSSERVPQDLPDILSGAGASDDEGRWEERATILARSNERSRSRGPPLTSEKMSGSHATDSLVTGIHRLDLQTRVDEGKGEAEDDNIQEAIRLHEEGNLTEATEMFGRLANPNGSNNALSQVLYGLALRHGWGVTSDPAKALQYLSLAASNAASIEDTALKSGRKQGGAAKGELVLALFELANSYQQGWGVKKDLVAAKTYYETAANLGDTDAMNEVARCHLEGIGCKKDKQASANYYRLAEKNGNKIIGNTWIWKEKYDPPK